MAAMVRGGEAKGFGSIASYLVGEVTTPPKPRKLRPGTMTRKGDEKGFFQPISRLIRGKLLNAIELAEEKGLQAHRADGNRRKNGPVGHIGVKVFRKLLFRANPVTGQLDLSLKKIAEEVGHSLSAVVEALKRLREHGWLSWLRRYVDVGAPGQKGPQRQQTSNAYRISLDNLPAEAPISADLIAQREINSGNMDAMLEALPPRDMAEARIQDRGLRTAMVAWADALFPA